MSTVFVHVGQCGNQVSQHLWKSLKKDDLARDGCIFTSHDGWHRAVHVDSEPKVVRHLQKIFKIREKNLIMGKRGRGTNWALGYHGLKSSGDDHLLEQCLNSIQKEVERCDMFSGIILTHSLTGGTGSGFGSRLCEVLREEYPLNYLMSITIAPHASGESPLQHYNSLLCLATLQRNVDCIILIQNDDVMARVRKKFPDIQVSFDSLNKVIGQTVAGLILPTDTLTTSRDVAIGQEPWEMLRSVCPMPATKFIYTAHLAKRACKFGSLAGLLVGRGDSTGTFPLSMKQRLGSKVRSACHFVDWNPFPLDVWTAYLNTQGPKDMSSVSMAINSSSVCDYLDTVCQRSSVMLAAGAYTHWYDRYGTTREDFQEAINTLQICQEDYVTAIKPGY